MMRDILMLNIITLLLFAGCGSDTNGVKNVKGDYVSDATNLSARNNLTDNSDKLFNNEVFMIVDPSIIKLSSVGNVKLIVKNNSIDSIKLNDRLSIDFYDSLSWKSLPVFKEILFNDIAYIIAPGEEKELLINLNPKPFNYKSGKYRINKKAENTKKNKEVILEAEFSIK